MPSPNPLTSDRPQKIAANDLMLHHARVWQHVNSLPYSDVIQKSKSIEYILPRLGELAGNPNVKSKDVIKAAAQAAADGEVSPDEAVKFISGMPPDPDKLQGWLKTLYAANLAAQVHMKAAIIQKSQQPSQAPQNAPAGAPLQSVAPPPASMTPGVSNV